MAVVVVGARRRSTTAGYEERRGEERTGIERQIEKENLGVEKLTLVLA